MEQQAQTKPEMGFIAACKDFFGFLPGQTLMTFRDECSHLSAADRVEIRDGLIRLGYNIKPL